MWENFINTKILLGTLQISKRMNWKKANKATICGAEYGKYRKFLSS